MPAFDRLPAGPTIAGWTMFARLGRWCATHRWTVVLGWLGTLIVVGSIAGGIGSNIRSEYDLPDMESRRGFDLLEDHFGGLGAGLRGAVVIQADRPVTDPEVAEPFRAFLEEVEDLDGVTVSSQFGPMPDRYISSQGDLAGRVAYADIEMEGEPEEEAIEAFGAKVKSMAPEIDGVDIEYGGVLFSYFEQPDSEMLGLAFAIFILILAFGSVLAMGLPVIVALGGIGVGSAIIYLLSNVMIIPEATSTLGIMLGLGVGIDYALFIVTRYREQLRAGHDVPEAVGIAIDTSGRAVLFAGLTVVISLLGMLIMRLGFITGLALGSVITVSVTMAASLTLLPALLGLAGNRIEVTRWRGLIIAGAVAVALIGTALSFPAVSLVAGIVAVFVIVVSLFAGLFKFSTPLHREVPTPREKPLRETLAYRWSRLVQAKPWTVALLCTAVLLGLSVPVLGMHLGFADDGNLPEESSSRRAYDLLADAFGPGSNGPLMLAAELPEGTDLAALATISDAIAATPGVASATPAVPNNVELVNPDPPDSPTAVLWEVTPETSPQDQATTELVHRLRNEVLPEATAGMGLDVLITGYVAVTVDISDYLAARLPWFFVAVLGMSFLLLMVVFRSLLVPVKAVIMNLLSIGAAYGLTVVVFQWGWGSKIPFFGIQAGPIEPFMPMMLFAIVFGLSMDYEVFLLSRIREEWVRTGDARESVADGLAATAKVISAAAAIMVFVFGSFILEVDRSVKLFGFGLAIAVLIDATIVRLLLVPATMELLGARNWWIPGWLDRILPRVNVEGSTEEVDEILDAELDPHRGEGQGDEREPELVQ
jgi:RND superfamily putative drug exporter